jgi:hypothetical protein
MAGTAETNRMPGEMHDINTKTRREENNGCLLTETTCRGCGCLHSAILLGTEGTTKPSEDPTRRERFAHRLDD